MTAQKIDIKSLSFEELGAFLHELSLPRFRTSQVFDWLHQKQVTSFTEMTNLSKKLIEQLDERAYITAHTIQRKLVSKIDGTVKYLFAVRIGRDDVSAWQEYLYFNADRLSDGMFVLCIDESRFCTAYDAV